MQVLKLKSIYFFTSIWKFCSYVPSYRRFRNRYQYWSIFKSGKNTEFTIFKTVNFSCSVYVLKAPFVTTVLPPCCASFPSQPSHIFSSCVPFLFFFCSLHFPSTYIISSVYRTRCCRLWCYPLDDSIYVLLSPVFNSSEQQGFEWTVSWKDTIHKTGRVLQRKEIPPFRCLRQTYTSVRYATCLTKHRRTVA